MGAGMVTVGASWYAFETSRARKVEVVQGKRDGDLKVRTKGEEIKDDKTGRRGETVDITGVGGLEKRSVGNRRRKV